MHNDATQALRGAVYRLLRPLARVMLRHGMAYGSFAELARKAFVEESLDQLRRSGKRSSISGVAAMTGLTRKEAARLASFDIEAGNASDQRYNRAVRVITAWAIDPRFVDKKGRPRVLAAEGKNSFATLVKEYSGDVPPAAMLATLESSGTVCNEKNGVRLLDRAYLPTQTPIASLNILGTDVAEIITSIDHNLTHDDSDRVFQRKVSNVSVRVDALAEFKKLSNRKSQQLLEEYDAWLSEHEVSKDTGGTQERHYVAVGIYYFDDTLHKDDEL